MERCESQDVSEAMVAVAGRYQVVVTDAADTEDNDDNEVHVLIRFGFRSRETGREATMNLHHFWGLRDGEIAY